MWCPSLTEITKCTMWSDYMCSMPLYFITNCQLHVQNVQYKSMWLCQTWSSHYDYIVYSIADHLYRWGQGNKTDSRPPIKSHHWKLSLLNAQHLSVYAVNCTVQYRSMWLCQTWSSQSPEQISVYFNWFKSFVLEIRYICCLP